MMPAIARGQTWLSQALPVSTVPNAGRSLFDSSDRGLDKETPAKPHRHIHKQLEWNGIYCSWLQESKPHRHIHKQLEWNGILLFMAPRIKATSSHSQTVGMKWNIIVHGSKNQSHIVTFTNSWNEMEYIVHGSKNQSHIVTNSWNEMEYYCSWLQESKPHRHIHKQLEWNGIYCSWLQESKPHRHKQLEWNGILLFMAPRIKATSSHSQTVGMKWNIIVHGSKNQSHIVTFTNSWNEMEYIVHGSKNQSHIVTFTNSWNEMEYIVHGSKNQSHIVTFTNSWNEMEYYCSWLQESKPHRHIHKQLEWNGILLFMAPRIKATSSHSQTVGMKWNIIVHGSKNQSHIVTFTNSWNEMEYIVHGSKNQSHIVTFTNSWNEMEYIVHGSKNQSHIVTFTNSWNEMEYYCSWLQESKPHRHIHKQLEWNGILLFMAPRIKATSSHSQTVGMKWNILFTAPRIKATSSHSQTVGMKWNILFTAPRIKATSSHSQTVGMKWNIIVHGSKNQSHIVTFTNSWNEMEYYCSWLQESKPHRHIHKQLEWNGIVLFMAPRMKMIVNLNLLWSEFVETMRRCDLLLQI